MENDKIIRGLARLVVAAEEDNDARSLLESIAKHSSAKSIKKAEKADHDALDATYRELRGSPERAAPGWAHDLLDWVWDLF